ncbi:MAG: hypothetical protein GYA36_21125 [Veillonellaceae bacterium]|nr:hypothetical protein [Veillonellaceae bacterium]
MAGATVVLEGPREYQHLRAYLRAMAEDLMFPAVMIGEQVDLVLDGAAGPVVAASFRARCRRLREIAAEVIRRLNTDAACERPPGGPGRLAPA